MPLEEYADTETRYLMLRQSDAARSEALMQQAQQDARERWRRYQDLASAHQNGAGQPERN